MSESKSCISIIILLSVENLISRKSSLNKEKKNQTIPRNFTHALVWFCMDFMSCEVKCRTWKRPILFSSLTHTHKKMDGRHWNQEPEGFQLTAAIVCVNLPDISITFWRTCQAVTAPSCTVLQNKSSSDQHKYSQWTVSLKQPGFSLCYRL